MTKRENSAVGRMPARKTAAGLSAALALLVLGAGPSLAADYPCFDDPPACMSSTISNGGHLITVTNNSCQGDVHVTAHVGENRTPHPPSSSLSLGESSSWNSPSWWNPYVGFGCCKKFVIGQGYTCIR